MTQNGIRELAGVCTSRTSETELSLRRASKGKAERLVLTGAAPPQPAPLRVLASRRKGCVTWQARISSDRGRLEVVGIIPPSASTTTFEPLNERELLELLGERDEQHDETA